jgi:hypothetical protein
MKVAEPATQLASAHGEPAAYRWHAPASHMPFVPQLDGACTTQVPDGSGALEATFVHWPMAPVSAQDLQALLHWDEQHTPCAQMPVAHSLGFEQKAPLPFLPHEPCASQVLGGTQSPLLPHEAKQRVPLQTKGAHGSEVGAMHEPVLLQTEAGV